MIMMSKIEDYKQLIYLFYTKKASREDIEYMESLKDDPLFQTAWDEVWLEYLGNQEKSPMDTKRLYERIVADSRIEFKTKKSFLLNKRLVAGIAASLLLCVSVAILLWSSSSSENISLSSSRNAVQISPGSDRASIILDDGSLIDLESIRGDTVIYLGNFSIAKTADGQISYQLNEPTDAVSTLAFNTIVTPKGGEYRLSLPDGTNIWLNAATTLRYPLVFSPSERVVELDGEAFFEVQTVKNGKNSLPFIVNTGKQRLEVLGTQFNVNSYDTQVVTTLIEGKVKLVYPGEELEPKVLNPNDQATYNPVNQKYVQRQVDPLYAIAWKTGDFAFDNASLYQVMADISRWYDLDVHYKGNFKHVYFSGAISRYSDIDKLLQAIAISGDFKFEIKGKEVFIME